MKATDKVAQIKSSLPISVVVKDAVDLRGSGPHFVGLCPFHQEKTPSFNVWDSQGTFKCFGCGAFGDVFEFIMRLRGLNFNEAKAELANRAGIENMPNSRLASRAQSTKIDPLTHAQNVAQDYFTKSLQEKSGAAARIYLAEKRGLHEKMIAQAGLGFGGKSYEEFVTFLNKNGVSTDCALKAGLLKPGTFSHQATFLGRITFPIKSFLGKIIAFGGRSFLSADDTAPKYVNTHAYLYYEKRRVFYGLFESKPAILKGRAPVLVEGYFDALAVWATGTPALALCGTSLSVEHVKLLKRLCSKVILCFDSDNAGMKALRSSLSLLLQNNFTVGAVELGKNDPGEYQSSGEIAALKELITTPNDALVSLIDQASLAAQRNLSSRIAELELLTPVLASIQRAMVRRQYVAHLAKGMNEDPAILWREIDAVVKQKATKGGQAASAPPAIKLNSRDKIVLQALRLYPKLKAEITKDILRELSPPVLALVAGFMDLGEGSFAAYLAKSDQAQMLLPEIHLEIPFKFEELQEIIRAIHRQVGMNDTKETLQAKRRELQLAHKKNDMSSILKVLAEQSAILAKNKPVVVKPLKLDDKFPKISNFRATNPQANLSKNSPGRRIDEIQDGLEMLSIEDDWL